MPLQKSRQQAPGGLGVATRLDNLVEHISVLINRSPQPAFLIVDAHHDFTQQPAARHQRKTMTYAASIIRAVLSAPSADGLVGNDDPAIELHFLDIAQAEIDRHRGVDHPLGTECLEFLGLLHTHFDPLAPVLAISLSFWSTISLAYACFLQHGAFGAE
ncbi:hypothetical protein ABID19_006733 [Mesorhizobium robiniae]|uniref:Uncharacterized protein n=1 Tax=Mesorhizobium robiniae TaxID=559315 RepID=A0ABV2GZF3_9HYPH